jgi:hypothetical protein
MALTWEQHQQNIFAGESGGDYDALYGYQNRPDGKFAGVKVSDMPIADVIKFTSPSGEYGQYVKGQVGRVATPVGAYQVVGSTLRGAVEALGLDPSQKFDKATQDKIGQYILKTQGTGAWEGYGKGGAAMAQEPQDQKPQGLLGGLLGGQGIGGALGLSPEFSDKLAMAVMAGSGDARLTPLIQQRAQSIQERKVTSRTKAQANATADYLEKIGQGDIANLLRQGGIDAKTALSAGTSKTKETADIQEYRLAQSQGYKGTFEAWQQLGKKKTEFGTIPVGYQLVEGVTPDGQPTYQMVPVEGSPAYIEEQERRRKQAKKGEGGDVMATNVLQTAGRARNLTSGWTVGYGQLLAGLPATDARELKAEVDALQAIASSENLNRMRQESPTGGALGNVSDADIKLLKDKSGALDPMSKPEVFAKQLDEYELLLLQTIHGTEAGTKLFGQTRGMYGQYSFEVEGQTSDKNAQNRSRFPNSPDIGTVSQGHVYNGGDPSDPKSWSAQ